MCERPRLSIKKKALEQFHSGKSLYGKDGAFGPMLKSFLEAALEGELDAHLDELSFKKVSRSMSRKGDCWDNAVAESFFKTIKIEMVYDHRFQTIQQAKLAVFEYIEIWYNKKRRHSALGYVSPEVYGNLLMNYKKAA